MNKSCTTSSVLSSMISFPGVVKRTTSPEGRNTILQFLLIKKPDSIPKNVVYTPYSLYS